MKEQTVKTLRQLKELLRTETGYEPIMVMDLIRVPRDKGQALLALSFYHVSIGTELFCTLEVVADLADFTVAKRPDSRLLTYSMVYGSLHISHHHLRAARIIEALHCNEAAELVAAACYSELNNANA